MAVLALTPVRARVREKEQGMLWLFLYSCLFPGAPSVGKCPGPSVCLYHSAESNFLPDSHHDTQNLRAGVGQAQNRPEKGGSEL